MWKIDADQDDSAAIMLQSCKIACDRTEKSEQLLIWWCHILIRIPAFCVVISEILPGKRFRRKLFFALLRQLDMERAQFEKRLEEFSEGQKKKVLIAASLMTPAHVYIWDEPLNYIDVFSRMQIEQLILRYQPTMILVDHDIRFQEKIATRVVEL